MIFRNAVSLEHSDMSQLGFSQFFLQLVTEFHDKKLGAKLTNIGLN